MAEIANTVLGQYTLYESLGRGGMATVNRAELRGLAGFRKPVALKRLHPHVALDPSMVQSFVHEARLASHLHHPNVAQTYDLGLVDDTYFIAMEYIPGPTLTQLLRQAAAVGTQVPIPIALTILGQICDALDYAHNLCDEQGRPLGIVHRDISPSNIIISSTGVVKLIDFGIAKVAGSEETETGFESTAVGIGKTDVGFVKGKFSYMAPEYLQGQLDHRADLFGLGVIAHELLTSRPLFQGKTEFDTITKLREMPIEPPSRWNPDVPYDLDDIVLTALQRSPELRWQSAAAMRTAITNVLRSLGGPPTSQELLEWIRKAFAQQAPRRSGSSPEASDAPSRPPPRIARGSGIDLALKLPAPADEPGVRPFGTEERTRPGKLTPQGVPKLVAPPEPRRARWGWLLLVLLLIVAAAATKDQLVAAGDVLYEQWLAEPSPPPGADEQITAERVADLD